jgi:hypothetical protein
MEMKTNIGNGGRLIFQAICLKNLGTAIRPDTTDIVVSFSLTHKGDFSIVLPIKSNVLSQKGI